MISLCLVVPYRVLGVNYRGRTDIRTIQQRKLADTANFWKRTSENSLLNIYRDNGFPVRVGGWVGSYNEWRRRKLWMKLELRQSVVEHGDTVHFTCSINGHHSPGEWSVRLIVGIQMVRKYRGQDFSSKIHPDCRTAEAALYCGRVKNVSEAWVADAFLGPLSVVLGPGRFLALTFIQLINRISEMPLRRNVTVSRSFAKNCVE